MTESEMHEIADEMAFNLVGSSIEERITIYVSAYQQALDKRPGMYTIPVPIVVFVAEVEQKIAELERQMSRA